MSIYLMHPYCNLVLLRHLSAPLITTVYSSNWIGLYLLQSSTSEPSGSSKELTDFNSASEEHEDLDCDNTQPDINYRWSNLEFLSLM